MPQQQCSAKAKHTGAQCRYPAVEGKRVCRYHGGLSTGPKDSTNTARNALKHGIYSAAILPGEEELYEAIELGSLDQEIRITRLQLIRAHKAQVRLEQATDPMAVLEVAEARIQGDGRGKRMEVTKRRPDHRAEIARLTRLVADLESRRHAMLDTAAGVDEIAKELLSSLEKTEDQFDKESESD